MCAWDRLPTSLAQDRGVIRPQICDVISPTVSHKTWGVIALHMWDRFTRKSCAGLVGICRANMCVDYLPTGMAPARRHLLRITTGKQSQREAKAHLRRASKQRLRTTPYSTWPSRRRYQHNDHNYRVSSCLSMAIPVIVAGLHYNCEAAPTAALFSSLLMVNPMSPHLRSR